jgi:GxxExxY protein
MSFPLPRSGLGSQSKIFKSDSDLQQEFLQEATEITEQGQKLMGGFEFSVLSVSACSMLASVHPLLGKASSLTEVIIAATIEVHRNKGPGLIESIYEWCLLKELELRDLKCVSQKFVPFEYKGFTRDEPLRLDLLVEDSVLVEAKALEKVLPIHKAQLLSYMKLLNIPLGLVINFHEAKVTNGISRLMLPGANR